MGPFGCAEGSSWLVLGAEIDDGHDDRGEDDPGELVPVEEWKAKEHRGGAGIEAGEEQARVGKKKEQEPRRGPAVGDGGFLFVALHAEQHRRFVGFAAGDQRLEWRDDGAGEDADGSRVGGG